MPLEPLAVKRNSMSNIKSSEVGLLIGWVKGVCSKKPAHVPSPAVDKPPNTIDVESLSSAMLSALELVVGGSKVASLALTINPSVIELVTDQ